MDLKQLTERIKGLFGGHSGSQGAGSGGSQQTAGTYESGSADPGAQNAGAGEPGAQDAGAGMDESGGGAGMGESGAAQQDPGMGQGDAGQDTGMAEGEAERDAGTGMGDPGAQSPGADQSP